MALLGLFCLTKKSVHFCYKCAKNWHFFRHTKHLPKEWHIFLSKCAEKIATLPPNESGAGMAQCPPPKYATEQHN